MRIDKVMMESGWIWMPHPAHFICADRCRFRLATVVGKREKFIVSTVGEMLPSEIAKNWNKNNYGFVWETLGSGENDFFETYVFKAVKSKRKCCPFVANVSQQVDGVRCGTAEKANKNHLKMCRKWSEK